MKRVPHDYTSICSSTSRAAAFCRVPYGPERTKMVKNEMTFNFHLMRSV